MARILVTGGAGFIGSHLVDALVKKNAHSVTVLDDLSVGKRHNVNTKARFVRMQVQSKRLDEVVLRGKFDYVYHLAAQKNLQTSKLMPVADAETNIVGSVRLFDASRRARVRKIIFFSSAAIYNADAPPPNTEIDSPAPCTPYGIAKWGAELYLQHSGVPYTIVRPSNVYGPRQDSYGEGGVVAIYCRNLAENKRVEIFNTGRQTRDFVYVADVVRAAIAAMGRGTSTICNISTQKETPINVLFQTLRVVAARPAMKPIRGKNIAEQYRSALANTRARQALNWKPSVILEYGLQVTYNWFNETYGKKTNRTA